MCSSSQNQWLAADINATEGRSCSEDKEYSTGWCIKRCGFSASLFELMAGTNIEEGERANGAACNGK